MYKELLIKVVKEWNDSCDLLKQDKFRLKIINEIEDASKSCIKIQTDTKTIFGSVVLSTHSNEDALYKIVYESLFKQIAHMGFSRAFELGYSEEIKY